MNKKPFAIEGFPSTINQYHLFVEFLKEGHLLQTIVLIYLDCFAETALKRIVDRLTCQECSQIYNLSYNLPRQENRCDRCGGILFHRPEDSLAYAKKRLQTFKDKTYPVIQLADENLSFFKIRTDSPLKECLTDFNRLLHILDA